MTYSVIGVPIDSVGFDGAPRGTELAPAALRQAGAVAALGAEDLCDLDVRIGAASRDRTSGIVAVDDVCRVTATIRDAVGEALNQGRRPFLLGGCCTQMMGALAGARDALGRVGVAYLDGHLDLYDGTSSQTGEAADVPLAVALGHGVAELVESVGPGAPVAEADAVLIGHRDLDEAAGFGSLLPGDLDPGFRHWSAAALRRASPAAVGREAREALEAGPGRFMIHIDWDVLSTAAFPATDALQEGGLDWDELGAAVAPLAASPACVGVALACYNPEKDANGATLARVVGFMKEVFGP